VRVDILQQSIKQLLMSSVFDGDSSFLDDYVQIGSLERNGSHPCWRCLLHLPERSHGFNVDSVKDLMDNLRKEKLRVRE